jgi:hypothetical protein
MSYEPQLEDKWTSSLDPFFGDEEEDDELGIPDKMWGSDD